MITIQLKPKREENVLRFHPWIFSGAIAKITGKPEEGDLVRVVSANQEFLAIGHYQIGSIMVRILSFTDRPIDRFFWYERLKAAYDMRVALRLAESDQCLPPCAWRRRQSPRPCHRHLWRHCRSSSSLRRHALCQRRHR